MQTHITTMLIIYDVNAHKKLNKNTSHRIEEKNLCALKRFI